MWNNSCSARFQSEVEVFNAVVYFSLALTFINVIISRAIHSHVSTDGGPGAISCGRTYHFAMGSVKIFLGVLLLAVLYPRCPPGCFCGSINTDPTYPIIVLIIGAVWLGRGFQYQAMLQEASAAQDLQHMELSGTVGSARPARTISARCEEGSGQHANGIKYDRVPDKEGKKEGAGTGSETATAESAHDALQRDIRESIEESQRHLAKSKKADHEEKGEIV